MLPTELNTPNITKHGLEALFIDETFASALQWLSLDCVQRSLLRLQSQQSQKQTASLQWFQRNKRFYLNGQSEEVESPFLWGEIQSEALSPLWHSEMAILWPANKAHWSTRAKMISTHLIAQAGEPQQYELSWLQHRLSFLHELSLLTERLWLAYTDECPIEIPKEARLSFQLTITEGD